MYVSVASGATVSSAFALNRGTASQGLVVLVPSLTATEVRVQFTSASGTAPFSTLFRADGTGIPFAVTSGPGPAWGHVPAAPTPWGRIQCTAAQTDTRTFEILERW